MRPCLISKNATMNPCKLWLDGFYFDNVCSKYCCLEANGANLRVLTKERDGHSLKNPSKDYHINGGLCTVIVGRACAAARAKSSLVLARFPS